MQYIGTYRDMLNAKTQLETGNAGRLFCFHRCAAVSPICSLHRLQLAAGTGTDNLCL